MSLDVEMSFTVEGTLGWKRITDCPRCEGDRPFTFAGEDGVAFEVPVRTGRYELPGGFQWVHQHGCTYDPEKERALAEGKVDLAELDLAPKQRSPAFRRMVRDQARRMRRQDRRRSRRPACTVRTGRVTRHARSPHRHRVRTQRRASAGRDGPDPPDPPRSGSGRAAARESTSPHRSPKRSDTLVATGALAVHGRGAR